MSRGLERYFSEREIALAVNNHIMLELFYSYTSKDDKALDCFNKICYNQLYRSFDSDKVLFNNDL